MLSVMVRSHPVGVFLRQEVDRTPHVPTEADLRRAALERAAKQEREWQKAVAAARAEFQEHRRREVLIEQANRWHEADQLREYLAAMKQQIDALPDEAKTDGAAWLSWAEGYLE